MATTARFILAIDQGASGSTALLIDETLAVRGKASREFRQVFRRPGLVEQEASAIWESVERIGLPSEVDPVW